MPYKSEIRTARDPWCSNACVYETEQEALAAGRELMGRWLLVTEYRATETDEPVNYVFVDGRPQRLGAENE